MKRAGRASLNKYTPPDNFPQIHLTFSLIPALNNALQLQPSNHRSPRRRRTRRGPHEFRLERTALRAARARGVPTPGGVLHER